MPSSTSTFLLLKILVSFWLGTVAVWDWRTGLIPNWMTLPVAAGAGGVQVYLGRWYVILIWILLFLIWRVHIIGGGDAKFLMGLFALFPTQQFALLFGVVVLVVSIPLMLLKHWSGEPLGMLRSIADTLTSGNPLPTEENLKRHGRRYAWTYCLPGIIYTWFFW